MKKIVVLLASLIMLALCQQSIAKGGGARSSGKSATAGTGSKSSSTSVHGYTKKSGTSVAPYKRSTGDPSKSNWVFHGIVTGDFTEA